MKTEAPNLFLRRLAERTALFWGAGAGVSSVEPPG